MKNLVMRVLNRLVQYPFVGDELAIRTRYRLLLGKRLNLSSPQSFNEKIQWLKLYDHNPMYCILVDKYLAKQWLSSYIDEKHIPKTLAVWEDIDALSVDGLPNRFVLKTNHDSGGVVICQNQSTFNLQRAKRILKSHLKKNYYWSSREWPYKNVRPLVFAEEYLDANGSDSLADYKIFCFSNGRMITLLCEDRFTETGLRETFFDENWQPLDLTEGGCNTNRSARRPFHFDEMKNIARSLSKGLPFVRVDFFESAGKLYVGEITLHPKSGFERFCPEEWDLLLGSWIDLSLVSKVVAK